MKHISKIRAVALIAITVALSACHTMHGVGEDTSSAGRAVQRAAD